MTDDLDKPPTIEEVAKALCSLERGGFLVSKLCEDGQIRWFATKRKQPELWDAGDKEEQLN